MRQFFSSRQGDRVHTQRARYPEYVVKAIFYAADDENVEVLLDQAIDYVANHARFDHLCI